MRLKERKTIKDYEALPEGAPYQLIDGEFVMSPAHDPFHQELLKRVFLKFFGAIEETGNGKVLFAPVDVYINEENAFQPDLVVLLKDSLEKIAEKGVKGAPDMVVEVLSPSTAYYDLRKKKEVYERAGVKEYWIVDPEMEEVEVYTNEGGSFRIFSRAKKEGKVRSSLIKGLEIGLEDLFKEVL